MPDVVRAAFDEANNHNNIRWVYLSTNGLGLTTEWLDYFGGNPKFILTVSMDGKAADHRKLLDGLERACRGIEGGEVL